MFLEASKFDMYVCMWAINLRLAERIWCEYQHSIFQTWDGFRDIAGLTKLEAVKKIKGSTFCKKKDFI